MLLSRDWQAILGTPRCIYQLTNSSRNKRTIQMRIYGGKIHRKTLQGFSGGELLAEGCALVEMRQLNGKNEVHVEAKPDPPKSLRYARKER